MSSLGLGWDQCWQLGLARNGVQSKVSSKLVPHGIEWKFEVESFSLESSSKFEFDSFKVEVEI